MTAIPLIFGRLTADDYEDDVASDPRVDILRDKMEVTEDKQYSIDYLDPEKRSIGNAVQIFFKDGGSTDNIAVEFPIGHRRRRAEGIPVLQEKFERNLKTRLVDAQVSQIIELCGDKEQLKNTTVNEFVDLWVTKE